MQDYHEQNNYENDTKEAQRPQKSKLRRFFSAFIILAILVGIGVVFAFKTGFVFSQMSVESGNGGKMPDQPHTKKDPDRINILFLGFRGEDDPNGGLLTDSIMLISVQKSTGKAALISIPRDLYVTVPNTNIEEKINYVYAYGEEKKRGGGGIAYSKAIVSEISGLYIDNAVSINHRAFKDTVDTVGGIDIYLDKPFVENKQFTNEIILELPAGKNHLDGNTALFFARSRYTTSDFDRMRRQQLVLLAVKDKVLSLGFLVNPVKIFNLLDILGKNVRTDLTAGEMQSMIQLASSMDKENIIRRVFDTTPEGLLHSTTASNGAYILLPASGNYSQMQAACKNIFQ